MTRSFLGVLAVLLAVGCGDGSSLTIRRTMVYVTEDGGTTTVAQLDPSVPIEAFSVDRGQLTALSVTREGDHAVVRPHHDGGVTLVHRGLSWYLTAAETLDLGTTEVGRSDVARVDAGITQLTLSTPGFDWFQPPADFELNSPGAGLFAQYRANPDAWSAGTGQVTVDYGGIAPWYSSAPRVEGSRGDTLYATWLDSTTASDPADPWGAGGRPTPGAFTDCIGAKAGARLNGAGVVGAQVNLTLEILRAPVVRIPVRSQPKLSGSALWVGPALPAAADYVGPFPDLLMCYPDFGVDADAGLPDTEVPVVSPYPTEWPLVMTAFWPVPVQKVRPDGGVQYYLPSDPDGMGLNQRLADPLDSPVGAPTALTVQGVADADLAVVSTATPVQVTWQPADSGLGTDGYQVTLRKLDPAVHGVDRTPASVQTVLAVGFTTGTSFIFPPNLFASGLAYTVTVRALHDPAADLERKPLEFHRPHSWHDLVSRPFFAQ